MIDLTGMAKDISPSVKHHVVSVEGDKLVIDWRCSKPAVVTKHDTFVHLVINLESCPVAVGESVFNWLNKNLSIKSMEWHNSQLRATYS